MAIDLYWTLDGDLALDRNGDLRDTSFDQLRSTLQEIRTRARSSLQDWAIHPNLGANLDALLGRPNNKFTAEEGRTNIISALTMHGFLKKNNVKVKYVPISRHQIAYFIEVKVVLSDTMQTKLLKTQLLYDTEEGSLKVV